MTRCQARKSWSVVVHWAVDAVCEVGNGGVNTSWIVGSADSDEVVSAIFVSESALAYGDCNLCEVDVGFWGGSTTGRSP